MYKASKRIFVFLLVVSLFFVFSLSAFATEDPEVEEPVVILEEIPSITATVTLDIGEVYIFTVNEDGSVESVEAATEEGIALLETLDFTGLTLEEIIQLLVDLLEEASDISIVVLSSDETLLALLEESLIATFGEVVEAILEVVIEDEEESDEDEDQPERISERFELAEEYAITPGKMNLLQKLAASSDEEIDYSLWVDSSIKDILKAIKENRKTIETNIETTEETDDDDDDDNTVKIKKNNGKAHGKNK